MLATVDHHCAIIRNGQPIMILSEGIDKGSGLAAALRKAGLRKSEVLAVGDAENDLAMIGVCGIGAANARAVPALRNQTKVDTQHGNGKGAIELIDAICHNLVGR